MGINKGIWNKTYHFWMLHAKALALQVIDWKNRETGSMPVPLPMLRYRVHGSLRQEGYLEVGQNCANDIRALLTSVGKDIRSCTAILDFGCGNGRVMRYFADQPSSCRLYGTDVDKESIGWCRKNLHFAEWDVNGFMPPMKYADGQFDLVYAISVFTHLDEAMQLAWLEELQRITKSGAILILTIYGEPVYHQLTDEQRAELYRDGIYFDVKKTGMFKHDGLPDFYQATYHTRKYIDEKWSACFEVIGYKERGMNGHQDAVVLQKR